MNKVILHIGSFKTGTTSIQDTFFSNSEILVENNIVYPMNTKNHRWLAYWDDGTRLANELGISKNQALNIMDTGKIFLSTLVKSNYDRLFFISSEFLYTTPKNELSHLKEYLSELFGDVIILAYVRNPSDMLTSWVSESVKNGGHTLASGMEKIEPYAALNYLYNYKDVFGLEKMVVRRYGEEYFLNGSLFEDIFQSCFGKNIRVKEIRSNMSLTLEALLVAEKVNSNFPINSPDRGFINYLYGISGQKFKVPKRYIQRIDNKAKPHLEKLFNEFGIEFLKTDLSQYPESINGDVNSDVINSIAIQLNKLSLTKNELFTLMESERLLKSTYPKLADEINKIILKSNPELIRKC